MRVRRCLFPAASGGLILILVLAMTALAQDPSPVRTRIPAASWPTAGAWPTPVVLGTPDPGEIVEVGIVLRGRDPGGLDRFLADLSDPASPDYHRYLTAEAFGDRFGADDAAVDRVTDWLAANGLTVTSTVPQHTSIRAQGTVAQLSALFGVTIQRLLDPITDVPFLGAGTPLAVPAELSDVVVAVTGLETQRPIGRPVAGDPVHPVRGLGPYDLALAYDLQALHDAGITGEGVAVAILSYGRDTDEDLAEFDRTFGLQGPTPERIKVTTGLTDPLAERSAGEATLDTQVVRSVAPGAQILIFEGGDQDNDAVLMDAIVADGRAKIATLSYGFCYAPGWVPISIVEALNTSLKAAVAAGVTLFVASGDTGAYTCHMFDKANQDISPAFPGCGDNLVSVGGTYLELNADGTYKSEAGWEDYLVVSGTGGGISPLDPRPAWQAGVPGIDNAASNGNRQCPDVAAPGDPDTGYLVYQTEEGVGSWKMIGGTSGASPFWAGLAALMQQAASQQGVDQLGFLGPVLYQAAAAHPDAFHDVTRGGNLLDNATEGWDYATGIGSPVGTKLTDAVIEILKGQ